MDYKIERVTLEGVYASGISIGFRLTWFDAGGGGEINIFTDDGIVCVDSEHMRKEFVVAVLTKLVNDAELVD